jgi:hypothetical protein
VLGLGVVFDILVVFLHHTVSGPSVAFTGRSFQLLIDANALVRSAWPAGYIGWQCDVGTTGFE